jgi:hypothetical protein
VVQDTFRKDLEDVGFIFNPYGPCVANKKFQGSQQTILFYVDDLKLSHKMKSVNDQFEKWLNGKYGKHRKRLLQLVARSTTTSEWN